MEIPIHRDGIAGSSSSSSSYSNGTSLVWPVLRGGRQTRARVGMSSRSFPRRLMFVSRTTMRRKSLFSRGSRGRDIGGVSGSKGEDCRLRFLELENWKRPLWDQVFPERWYVCIWTEIAQFRESSDSCGWSWKLYISAGENMVGFRYRRKAGGGVSFIGGGLRSSVIFGVMVNNERVRKSSG